jgi:RNA polymerase subunit RPABC4/transcription elongation factor Spt4
MSPDATPFHSVFAASAGGAAWLLCLGFMLVRRRVTRSRAEADAARAWRRSTCEVRRVSLGFDWTARAALQQQLNAAEQEFDLSTARGMHAAALQTVALLQGALDAARYASWESARHQPAHAQDALDHLDTRLRGRFSELLTAERANATNASGPQPHSEEGRGFVVVSVLVGTTRPLAPLPQQLSRAALPACLNQLIPSGPDAADVLVSWVVVWSPAQDADRLSSLELEALYPDLLALDGSDDLGQRACTYCHAVFTAELGACPCCGADLSSSQTGGAAIAPEAILGDVQCTHCPTTFSGHLYRCPSCGAGRFKS